MAVNRQKLYLFSPHLFKPHWLYADTDNCTELPQFCCTSVSSRLFLTLDQVQKMLLNCSKKCYWLSSKKPLLFPRAKGQTSSGSEVLLKDLIWYRRITDYSFKAGKYVRHMWHDYNQKRALICPQNLTTQFLSITLDHFSKETGFLSSKSLKEFLLSSVLEITFSLFISFSCLPRQHL